MLRHSIGLALGALIVLAAPAVAAPFATVTGVVLDVTYRTTPAASWARARVGTRLQSGARIRTAARSKCEVKFPDGSRVRLNERSDLLITDAAAKGLSLARGNLYAKVIAGTGARIAGARGVASIKGTTLGYDGETLAIYEGQATHELERGNEEVPAGTASHCDQPGVFAVPDEKWEGGQFRPWFTDLRDGVNYQAMPGTPAGERAKYTRSGLWAGVSSLLTRPDSGTLDVIVDGARPVHAASVSALGGSWAGGLASALLAATPGSQSSRVLTRLPHLTGDIFGPAAELQLYGIEGEGRQDLAGAQARLGFMSGDWFLGLGGMTQARQPSAASATYLSEAFLTYRDDRLGDFTAGRQWFLQGPANNTRVGSLCTFDIADAVRWQGPAAGLDLDLAYLDDMVVPSATDVRGGLARVQGYALGGELALNALYDADQSHTGLSCDFAIPVWPSVMDVYGEFGSDPSGRHLETWGAYFAGLFKQTGLDLYIERAERAGAPALTSASLYHDFADGWTAVALYRDVEGEDPVFGIGLAKSSRAE